MFSCEFCTKFLRTPPVAASAEAYSQPCQSSQMKLFAKIVNSFLNTTQIFTNIALLSFQYSFIILLYVENYLFQKVALRENCPYLEFFWSVFSRIWTISQYSIWLRQNVDQKNSEYEHFSRIVRQVLCIYINAQLELSFAEILNSNNELQLLGAFASILIIHAREKERGKIRIR